MTTPPIPVFEPEASAKVRTAIYWIAGIATILTGLSTAVVIPTWPDDAAIIMLWITAINTAIDALAVFTAVKNRPTKFAVAAAPETLSPEPNPSEIYGRHAP